MERAMHGSAEEPQRAAERVKPEAQDIAKKSIQGLMDKFLKQVRYCCERISRCCSHLINVNVLFPMSHL